MEQALKDYIEENPKALKAEIEKVLKEKGIRGRPKQKSIEEIQNTITTEDKNCPDKKTEQTLFKKHVQKALQDLSPKERAVFIMRHYQDMKMKDIGKTLHIATGSVKSMLFRSLKKLEKQLTYYSGESYS